MDQEYVNRVEAYIGGKLTEEEEKDFQRQIREKSELAKVYQEYMLAMETVDRQEERRLTEKFKNWKKQQEAKTRELKVFPHLWKVAASFLLIVGFYFVFIQTGQEYDTYVELAQSKYELPESYGRIMGSNDVLWQKGMDAYETLDFEGAARLWSSIGKPTQEMQYFLAHAYFNTGTFENAASLFSLLSEKNDSYSSNSDWFLLLTYLMMEKLDLFDAQCNKILKIPNHPYLKDVQELKKETRKMHK